MAKAYCIVNILRIRDREQFAEYVRGHVASIEKFGGRFLVKGDRGDVLEGSWDSNLVVVHEFPDLERFEAWYHSEDYRPWKELRQSCAEVRVLLARGC